MGGLFRVPLPEIMQLKIQYKKFVKHMLIVTISWKKSDGADDADDVDDDVNNIILIMRS